MIIQRLGPNLKGRDFVIGDIHGSFSCVEHFLKRIKFRKTNDRLICAGDLVDRGPENEKCLDLINQKWFFTTQGNHEELMYKYFNGEYLGRFWGKNGGYWGEKYTSPAGNPVLECVKKLQALPYLITVEKRNGEVFHVLHAELPSRPDIKITDKILQDEVQFLTLACKEYSDGANSIVWRRDIFSYIARSVLNERTIAKFKRHVEINKLDAVFNPELSHIYSGHTVLKSPVRFKGQTNLDTCAYGSYSADGFKPQKWCGLSVTEPATGKFWFVNDTTFKNIEPIVID